MNISVSWGRYGLKSRRWGGAAAILIGFFRRFFLFFPLILVFIGCQNFFEPTKFPPMPGSIAITPNLDVKVHTPLQAVYVVKYHEIAKYQWNRDGQAIPGAQEIAYTPEIEGDYSVTVSAAWAYRPRTSAAVRVTNASLSQLSGSITLGPYEELSTGVELTAEYNGSEAVAYQWYRDGVAISGATGSIYTPHSAGE